MWIVNSDKSVRFMLARLQIDTFRSKPTVRALRKALEEMPDTSYGLYERILATVFAQPREAVDLARKILVWMLHALRPLTAAELRHALAIENGDTEIDPEALPDEEAMLSSCNGMITADSRTRELRFVRKYPVIFTHCLPMSTDLIEPS